MTQSHFPGLYFLIHFSAEVPSVFQLPSLLHVLVMRRSPSLVALPHNPPTGSPRGRGNPSSKAPEACRGAGNPERGERPRPPPSGDTELRERAGVRRLGSLRPRPRPRRGLEKEFRHPPSFNSTLLRGCAARALARLPATWPRPGRPRTPRVTGLFPSLSRPGRAARPPVPEFSSPWARRASAFPGSRSPSRAPSQRGALAPLTPPGGGAGAGPAAEPPPTASPARRAGGWLGRLHLLFLKRRGADERHHWSPGPGHCHTRRPALRSNSSGSGGGGQSGGRAPER